MNPSARPECVAGLEVAFKGGQMGSRTFFDEARRG